METLIKRKPHLIEHRMTAILSGQRRALDECFHVFKVIHQLVDSEEDILMVAKAVIQEFVADGLTKQRYIEIVLEAIRQCKREEVATCCFYVTTVKLAEDFLLSSDGIVVGIDLSGDPTVGHGKDLLSALEKAKNCGLKLALHLSEVRSELLLNLPPDRIGHGTFLHPEVGGSDSLVDKVCKQNIPIEMCLTSNVKGQTVPSYDKHHFQYWYKRGHPCVLCTDDKGVDLSQEYQLAASTFGLTQEAVWMLSQQAIGYTFAPEPIKQRLEKKWAEFKQQILQ
uniref:Adenosine deaminase-like n=1 Tax=Sinocyclocheilus anshuiensis TaxID=1608454 RepID=A0A671SR43_9TELE